MRGQRLQVDGLDLDDESAERVRTSLPRAAYFKQKRSLSVHRERTDSHLLTWVEATLDGILDARVSRDPSSYPGSEHL